jgi:hypothetical protein
MDDTAVKMREVTQRVFVECSEMCGARLWLDIKGLGETSENWLVPMHLGGFVKQLTDRPGWS